MQELQYSTKTTPDKLVVYIPCPGLSKDEVTIAFDSKQGELDIAGKSKDKELSEIIETTIEGKIKIDSKYRSKSAKAAVKNGILTVTFGLAEDVNIVKFED